MVYERCCGLDIHQKMVVACLLMYVKRVPGRKTDVRDAEWLADLLRHGLLRGASCLSTVSEKRCRCGRRHRISRHHHEANARRDPSCRCVGMTHPLSQCAWGDSSGEGCSKHLQHLTTERRAGATRRRPGSLPSSVGRWWLSDWGRHGVVIHDGSPRNASPRRAAPSSPRGRR